MRITLHVLLDHFNSFFHAKASVKQVCQHLLLFDQQPYWFHSMTHAFNWFCRILCVDNVAYLSEVMYFSSISLLTCSTWYRFVVWYVALSWRHIICFVMLILHYKCQSKTHSLFKIYNRKCVIAGACLILLDDWHWLLKPYWKLWLIVFFFRKYTAFKF